MATISDIAKKSGFSIATVSRILNYDSALKVPEATKQKVFETAEALNYTKYKSKQKEISSPKKHCALPMAPRQCRNRRHLLHVN